MAIYEFTSERITAVSETTFGSEGLKERADLQRLLRANIAVVSPDTMVIAEEFGDWQESKRRIDLIGLDKDANLVVIELKRTEDGGHMELQAIRYAAMISTMTFEQVVAAREEFQSKREIEGDAQEAILRFLDWVEPSEEQFAQAVRIVLVSADFSKELTTAVMWLNNHDLDIRCVRLKPYTLDNRVLVDAQQVIPLPEAAEYQVQVKEKTRKGRKGGGGGPDWTRFDVTINGEQYSAQWKRNAIRLVARDLVQGGIAPERIAELMDWRTNRVWRTVDSEVGSEAFVQLAAEAAQKGEAAFDSRRWFCNDDELLHVNGRTYAFSNQWGAENWHKAMKRLVSKFPKFKITYAPSG